MRFCAMNVGASVAPSRVNTQLTPQGSAVLVSPNPTNLVLAGASRSPSRRSPHLCPPFPCRSNCDLPRLARHVPRGGGEITSRVRPTFKEKNPHRRPYSLANGVSSSGPVLLTATLGVPVGASILSIPIWQITVPSVVIVLHRDVVYDWYTSHPAPQPSHHGWARQWVFLYDSLRTYTGSRSTSPQVISLQDP